jgi:superfamily II DNA/RNA helicase
LDTARYLLSEVKAAGIEKVAELDSGSKANRAQIIRRFAPYYNGSSSNKLKSEGLEEIQVLIATDVLSEGLNLQDATRLINYDIHWNPVRLMQRIGRVDRRMNPDIERSLTSEHPERKESRGKILFWNFLPPDEINAILSLFKRVTGKALLISKTLGIEGKKFISPEDDFEALRQFNHSYEGSRTIVEDMHLEYQQLLKDNPQIAARLETLPTSMFSGRKRPAKGTTGVFFCYRLPALDTELNEFTQAAGTTHWYLYDLEREAILGELSDILESIRSKPTTPRKTSMEEKSLVDIRGEVLKHIKNTYLKRLDAPIGVKPELKCWMELNEGS